MKLARAGFIACLGMFFFSAAVCAQNNTPPALPLLPVIQAPAPPVAPTVAIPEPKKSSESGMKHMSFGGKNTKKPKTKDPSPKTETPALQEPEKPAVQDDPAIPNSAVAADKPFFTPQADVKLWGKIGVLMSGTHQKQMDDALKDVALRPAQISPFGLLLAANSYTQRGDLKQAALYYYLAQLRYRFDQLRWPKNFPSAQNTDTQIQSLTQQYGPLINSWVMADTKRLEKTVQDVLALDAKTPYDYHPGHTMSFEIPEKDLAAAHKKARVDFMTEMQTITQALKTLQR